MTGNPTNAMVCDTPYLQNEFGDPRLFYVFNLILSFSTCSQSFNKICEWEVLGANVLNRKQTSMTRVPYIEDITRWREDMNFMFDENIKFISSSQRVMFFLLYGESNSTKAKGGNRDVIERYDTHKGDIRKIRHSGPG